MRFLNTSLSLPCRGTCEFAGACLFFSTVRLVSAMPCGLTARPQDGMDIQRRCATVKAAPVASSVCSPEPNRSSATLQKVKLHRVRRGKLGRRSGTCAFLCLCLLSFVLESIACSLRVLTAASFHRSLYTVQELNTSFPLLFGRAYPAFVLSFGINTYLTCWC